MRMKSLTPLALSIALAACGGGGSGGGGTTPGGDDASSSVVASSSSSSSSAVSSSSLSSASSSSLASASVCGVEGTPGADSAESMPTFSCLTVDQFGYLPAAGKVAVLRDPQTGFDADHSYTPPDSLSVIDLDSGEAVFSGAPAAWNNGATHANSGDRAWQLDFSAVNEPGRYAVVDAQNGVRSPAFRIGEDVYRNVLIQAVRSFFYQRAGHAKQALYAADWADTASHLGEGQDPEARLYSATDDASTERNLRGGWYDAGDYNKYTNWHSDYLRILLHSYRENPDVWTDDFNIPESGNGTPDLLDEIKWGMDWLVRMQEMDGSVLSVMGLDHASPPSAADGESVYGPATTAASLSAAAAFAYGAEVFAGLDDPEWAVYASDLEGRAEHAWQWALDNPDVRFCNSGTGAPDWCQPEFTGDVAAGEQGVEDASAKKLTAAVHLFALTGDSVYRDHVDDKASISWVSPWNQRSARTLLHYAGLENATESVAQTLRDQYVQAMQGEGNWAAVAANADPFKAYLSENNFTWGSNRTMAQKGLTFANLALFDLGGASSRDIDNAALGYLNHLHGVNALGKVYLSNMGDYGAENSVGSFYHSWFTDGSADWDSVATSNYGPAPGYLVGGPNPSYDWDGCCPDSCGGSSNNAMCGTAPMTPPAGQPPMKSYKDFNDSWPLNSWQVTENHNDYQVAYIRLLSRFVN